MVDELERLEKYRIKIKTSKRQLCKKIRIDEPTYYRWYRLNKISKNSKRIIDDFLNLSK
jgi:hypothetical protein